MDLHLRQPGLPQGFEPMVPFRGFADRMAQLVREHELMVAYAQSAYARPQPLPQVFRDGHEPYRGARLRGGEPQDAMQVLRVEPLGYHRLPGQPVLLDLPLHEYAGHAVPAFQLVGHERVPFAGPHAGCEREFEQQRPHFQSVGGFHGSALRLGHPHRGFDHPLRLVEREYAHLLRFHARRPHLAARIHGDELLELRVVEQHLQAHEMILQRGRGEPLPQHAHAMPDMLRGKLPEPHISDDLVARLQPALAGAVRVRFDARPVIPQPAFRVVDQIR